MRGAPVVRLPVWGLRSREARGIAAAISPATSRSNTREAIFIPLASWPGQGGQTVIRLTLLLFEPAQRGSTILSVTRVPMATMRTVDAIMKNQLSVASTV